MLAGKARLLALVHEAAPVTVRHVCHKGYGRSGTIGIALALALGKNCVALFC